MKTYEELLERYKKVTDDFDQTIKELEQESQDIKRIRSVVKNTGDILDD